MSRKNVIRNTLLIACFLLATTFYYLPYYVSKPGMAKELEPIVEVEGGYDEKGSFMLTTVRMGRANIYSYLMAKISKYQEIYTLNEIRGESETDEEYNVRQLYLMDSSKWAAIEVAYKKVNIPVDVRYKGVYVLNVVPGMPADGKLLPADRIFKVDGSEFTSSAQFMNFVSQVKVGDSVVLTYDRNNVVNEVRVKVAEFKQEENQGKVGIGIGLVDDKDLIVHPEVTVHSDEIGGPSAGFMFSLEIYNQLTKEDLTKGYKIAGTGTISSDGTVGKIGGIEQKVVAADKAGAEIFFAPNGNDEKDSNYQNAVLTAKDIHSNMEIVPINTFDEAIDYLEELDMKK
jgi:Lon-like protease